MKIKVERQIGCTFLSLLSLFVHRVDAQLITADFQFLFVDVYTVLPLLPVLISPIGLLNICDTGLCACVALS